MENSGESIKFKGKVAVWFWLITTAVKAKEAFVSELKKRNPAIQICRVAGVRKY